MNKGNFKGIVSVGNKLHEYYTSRALLNNEMLIYLIAGKKINNNMIPNKYIHNIQIPQYLGGIIRRFSKNFSYNLVSDVLFDKLARFKIKKDIDFFIGFNNYVLEQIKKLRKSNTVIILDQRTAHGNVERQVGIEESGKIPINLSNKMMRRKEKEIDLADYILVPSDFVFQSMIENGISREKLILLPYGYDPNLFYITKNKDYDDKLKLIFVGLIGHRKGCEYLLKAIKKIKQTNMNISLTMVGSVEKEFKDIFEEYREYIEYRGYVSNEELIELYNESDIFILPSLCEGSALVTYEAAACGLPLIVTHNTGSIIENEKEGIIIKERDVDAIEQAIIKLYENINLRLEMRKNIIHKIKDYTWDKYEEKLINIIRSKVEDKRKNKLI